jgi:hypothetical protein
MRTTKISISIDLELLRRAREAAESEGSSLSAYIGRALGNRLENQGRLEAARELWREWGPESVPSQEERSQFVASMSRARKRRPKAA